MIPTSAKAIPAPAITCSIDWTVCGFTALQSTNTGLRGAPASSPATSPANSRAQPGGRTDSRKSASASCASSTGCMPAATARSRLATLRPVSVVSTLTP